MKRILVLILLLPLFILSVSAADKSEIISGQADKSGMNSLYQSVPQNTKSSLNKLGVQNPDSSTLMNFTPSGLFNIAVSTVQDAASSPVKAVMAVLGVLLACALLATMQNSFGQKPLKSVFDLVCALSVAAILLVPVSTCISTAAQIIRQSSAFMISFLPVFAGLAAVSGHPASATVFQGVVLTAAQAISEISTTTFVPMVDIYLGFCVVGSVSPGVNVTGIAGFVRKFVDFGLVLCLTIFTGLLTVQGIVAQAADSVTAKTAKFVVGNVVPVVGSTIGDAMTTVISCANLLKTSVGAYAIIVFLLAYLPPVVECLLWLLVADLSIAIAETLGVESVTGLFRGVKEALRLLLALVLTTAFAMLISVSVMLLLGMGST